MKKALLILMMFLLPLQSLIAAERNFAHVMEGYNTYGIGFVAKHMTEHSSEILHHVHLDDSQKSSRHLSDFEHGNSMNLLFPPPFQLPLVLDIRIAPEAFLDTFSDRATLPLLRPPRSPV